MSLSGGYALKEEVTPERAGLIISDKSLGVYLHWWEGWLGGGNTDNFSSSKVIDECKNVFGTS